MQTFTNFC